MAERRCDFGSSVPRTHAGGCTRSSCFLRKIETAENTAGLSPRLSEGMRYMLLNILCPRQLASGRLRHKESAALKHTKRSHTRTPNQYAVGGVEHPPTRYTPTPFPQARRAPVAPYSVWLTLRRHLEPRGLFCYRPHEVTDRHSSVHRGPLMYILHPETDILRKQGSAIRWAYTTKKNILKHEKKEKKVFRQ